MEAEAITNYPSLFAAIRESTLAEVCCPMSMPEAVASSAVKTVRNYLGLHAFAREALHPADV